MSDTDNSLRDSERERKAASVCEGRKKRNKGIHEYLGRGEEVKERKKRSFRCQGRVWSMGLWPVAYFITLTNRGVRPIPLDFMLSGGQPSSQHDLPPSSPLFGRSFSSISPLCFQVCVLVFINNYLWEMI